MQKIGTLYIVGTPIGNLEDMSGRAIKTLKEVSLIAAEDTRHTKKLLSHFDIHTPMESYHKFNEREKTQKLVIILKEGRDIALVTNAGMPGISDPGEILVREAVKNGIRVIPIPGPTASVLALIASGLPAGTFLFEGFLPREKGLRRKILYSLKDYPQTMIFYENGTRIKETLSEMEKIFGDRNISISRELTKKFEETIRGKFSNILKDFLFETKGEFVIIVEGLTEVNAAPMRPFKEEIEILQKELGITAKEAIKLTAAKFNIQKRTVYNSWIDK